MVTGLPLFDAGNSGTYFEAESSMLSAPLSASRTAAVAVAILVIENQRKAVSGVVGSRSMTEATPAGCTSVTAPSLATATQRPGTLVSASSSTTASSWSPTKRCSQRADLVVEARWI
jgi:hypothetical protein